jgi:hypothetical protein
LRPTLNFFLDQSFSRTIEESVDTHRVSGNLSWSISDIMNINDGLGLTWGDGQETTVSNTFTLSVTPSPTHRFSLNYIYAAGNATLHSFGGTWSWNINSVFNLDTGGTYRIAEDQEDVWAFSTTLRFTFSPSR